MEVFSDIWSAILSDIPSTLNTLIILVMMMVFLYDRRRSRNEGTSNFQSSMQVFNQAVLNDDDFIKYDCQLHPFGCLSEPEMKKVYYWFLAFNISYAAVQASKHKSMRSKLAKSSLANIANISFGDREFIETHVFSRGYDGDFVKEFKTKWQKIEDDNKTLLMAGAPESSRVAPCQNIGFSENEITQDLMKIIGDPDRTSKERRAMLTKLMKYQAEAKNQETEKIVKAE
jgi:hypothetical protein